VSERTTIDKDANVYAVRDMVLEQYEASLVERHPAVAPRDQHAESIGGLLYGTMTVEDVPLDLRHGTFSTPATYDVQVRYSTSSPVRRPDRARDAIGVAIKVHLPDGREHDLVLADYPTFFCRDAADLRELVRRSPSVTRPAMSFFLPSPWPPRWRLRELWSMLRAARLKRRVVNPLQETYYSQTTYALGPEVVRYVVRPTRAFEDHAPSLADGFREAAMARQLRAGPVILELCAQAWARELPLDDPTRRWDARRASLVPLAQVALPRQDFLTEEALREAEAIVFNPTNTPPEHRALGSINRVRAVVYEAISRRRSDLNEA